MARSWDMARRPTSAAEEGTPGMGLGTTWLLADHAHDLGDGGSSAAVRGRPGGAGSKSVSR